MGFRFRKSVSFGKAFRLNFSKRGVGGSVRIPGTGLSYGVSPARGRPGKPGCLSRLIGGVVLCVLFLFLGLFGLALLASLIPRPAPVRPPAPTPGPSAPAVRPVAQPETPPSPDPAPVAGIPTPGPSPETPAGPAPLSAEDGSRATSILQMGASHERDGRVRPAILCYSQVVNAWPGSPQAGRAADRVRALGGVVDPAALPSGISALPSGLARRPPRARRVQDFSGVDEAIGSMGAGASSGSPGGSGLCGATTQKGTPCRNPAVGGGRCHLHQ